MTLHPAFAGLVSRMLSAQEPDVRAAFARQAANVAATSGLTLDAALTLLDGPLVPWTDAPDDEASSDPARQIEDLLRADPSQSDRAIARAVPCSPTIVGRVRKRLGLGGSPRIVRRGGQRYSFGGSDR